MGCIDANWALCFLHALSLACYGHEGLNKTFVNKAPVVEGAVAQ
jgi:hypothetical protein